VSDDPRRQSAPHPIQGESRRHLIRVTRRRVALAAAAVLGALWLAIIGQLKAGDDPVLKESEAAAPASTNTTTTSTTTTSKTTTSKTTTSEKTKTETTPKKTKTTTTSTTASTSTSSES
jgi:hypothetical protein